MRAVVQQAERVVCRLGVGLVDVVALLECHMQSCRVEGSDRVKGKHTYVDHRELTSTSSPFHQTMVSGGRGALFTFPLQVRLCLT